MTVSELRALVDNLEEYIHVPGGIDRLKKMVLHLAVSGQLVPQDPSEGTGEELYREIQAERAELVKQGKIKRQKQLPEVIMNKTNLSIPAEWKWVKLGNVLFVTKLAGFEYTNHFKLEDKGEVPVVRAQNVRDWVLDKRSLKYISSKTSDALPRSALTKECVLVTFIGANIGQTAYFCEQDRWHLAPNVAKIENEVGYGVDLKYITLYLLSPDGQSELFKSMKSTAQPSLSMATIRDIDLPLPPLAEQKRTVAKVDSIFTLINQLSTAYKAEQAERNKLVVSSLAQLAKAENIVEDSIALTRLSEIIRTKADAKVLRRTILHLAVSGQLVPQDPSEGTGEALYQQIQVEKLELIKRGKLKKQKPLPTIDDDEALFTIPGDWKWARLGDLSDIFNGNSINASEKKLKYEKVTDGYPYIATKDIGYGFEDVDYENGVKIPFSEDKFKIISEGTALICSEGGSAGKKCGIVDRDVAFGNKMYAFKAFGGLILPEFVLYNYLSKQFYEQFSGKMTGIIGGISTASFKQLLMPLPPLAEQKRIVAKTTQLLNLVTELEKHLEK